MAKFHANPHTGDVSACRATVGDCPFGELLHGETPQEAEKAFGVNFLSKQANDPVYQSLQKAREVIDDPDNEKAVTAAKTFYNHARSLSDYKKRDQEIKRAMARMTSTNPSFEKLARHKIQLEKAIAELDPDSVYAKDDSSRTVLSNNKSIQQQEDFKRLDAEWRQVRENMLIDTGALWNMDSVRDLERRRDEAAAAVGEPSIAEISLEERRIRAAESIEDFAKLSEDDSESTIHERRRIAIDNHTYSKLVGDDESMNYWKVREFGIKVKELENRKSKYTASMFSSISNRRLIKNFDSEIQTSKEKMNNAIQAGGGLDSFYKTHKKIFGNFAKEIDYTTDVEKL